MFSIARRNLLHDRVRLVTALAGVVVAVVLVTCLAGLYIACSEHASGLVDHSGADLWLVAPGTTCVDRGEPVSMRRYYQAMATPGVAWAEPLVVRFSQWRLPDGRQELAEIVGIQPGSRLGIPWGESAGCRAAIRMPHAVVIDERERDRFGAYDSRLAAGEHAEILGRRATVVKFTKGIGSFHAIPYVFTDFRRAQNFTGYGEQSTTYVLVKVADGASVSQVRDQLQASVKGVDVLTSEQFAEMTREYWLYRTGLGTGMVFAAALGLIVGSVMVSQTIYASTMNRLSEYATLKALGMGNGALCRIVLEQAVWLGLLSYGIGMTVTTILASIGKNGSLSIFLPTWLYLAMLGVTLAICAGASVSSIAKVFRLPPAAVFGNG